MSEPLKSPLAEKDRRKKVWSTEDQILAAIEGKKKLIERKRCLAIEKGLEAKRLAIEAEELDEEARGAGTTFAKEKLSATADYRRKCSYAAEAEAKKADRAIDRTQNKTIPRLSQALAAMRTVTMPDVLGRYKGVVV